MSACGIPVVTKKANGLLDTVINGKTGYLISNERELANRIIRILKNNKLNYDLGREGKRYVEFAFLPEKIIEDWLQLFSDIVSNESCKVKVPKSNYFNQFKWMRKFNYNLHKLGIKSKPVIEIESLLKGIIHRR